MLTTQMSIGGRREVSLTSAAGLDDEIGDDQDIDGNSGDLDAVLAASRQRAEVKSNQVRRDNDQTVLRGVSRIGQIGGKQAPRTRHRSFYVGNFFDEAKVFVFRKLAVSAICCSQTKSMLAML